MISHVVILPVIWPLLLGALLLLLQKQSLQVLRIVSISSVSVLVLLAGWLLSIVNDGEILVCALGNWLPPLGIVLVADGRAV